jgi:hypothetical protein
MKVYFVELSDEPVGTRRVLVPDGPMGIEFELDDGSVINVPLHRNGEDGRLEIRCSEGRLIVRPHVANEVSLSVEKRY